MDLPDYKNQITKWFICYTRKITAKPENIYISFLKVLKKNPVSFFKRYELLAYKSSNSLFDDIDIIIH